MPDPIIPTALPDAVVAKMLAVSKTFPKQFQDIAVAYAPAIIRLMAANGNQDLTALYNQLVGLSSPAALDAIHLAMTRDELEAEKILLSQMVADQATASYQAQQIFQQMLKAALSAGISLALTAAGF